MVEFRVFDYRDADAALTTSVYRLYDEVFHVNVRPDFARLYLDNPYGAATAAVALADGEVIGHFAALPLPFLMDGVESTELLSLGAMVSPQYQGKGVFSKMAASLLATLDSDSRYNFIIALPNDNSLHVHLHSMGYLLVRDFSFVVFKRTHAPSVRQYHQLTQPLRYPPSDKPFSINGDEAFCKWRFSDRKYRLYEDDAGNQYVVTAYGDTLQILLSNHHEAIENYLDFVAFLYWTQGPSAVATWNTINFGDSLDHTQPRKYHFTIRPLRHCRHDTQCLSNHENWTYHMSDNELF